MLATLSPTAPGRRDAAPDAVKLGLVQKQRIVTAVIEGRLSLAEAADGFRDAHRAGAACLERATGVPAPLGGNETWCRTVIGWVCLTLKDRPEQADRVSDQLERELQTDLERSRRSNPTGR